MRFALRRAKSIDDSEALLAGHGGHNISATAAAAAAAAAASASAASNQNGSGGLSVSGSGLNRPYSSSRLVRPLSRSSNASSLKANMRHNSLSKSPRHSETADTSGLSDLIFQSGPAFDEDRSPSAAGSPNGRSSPLARRHTNTNRLSASPTLLDARSPRQSMSPSEGQSSAIAASFNLLRSSSANAAAFGRQTSGNAVRPASLSVQPPATPVAAPHRSSDDVLQPQPHDANTSPPSAAEADTASRPSSGIDSAGHLSKIADTFNAAPPGRRRRESAIMDVSQLQEALQAAAAEGLSPTAAESDVPASPLSPPMARPAPSFFQLAREAQDARRQGRFQRSIVLYRRALATGTNNAELKKAALINLALSIEGVNDLDASEAQFREALAFCCSTNDLQGQAEVHSHLGVLLEKQARFVEAKRHHTKAFTLFNTKLKDKRGQSVAASNLGSLYSAMGRPKDALRWHILALEALEQCDTKASAADYSTCHSHIGMLYYELGNIGEAVASHERDYEVCAAMGTDLAATVAAGKRLVSLLLEEERLDEALGRLSELATLVSGISERLREEYIRVRTVYRAQEAEGGAEKDDAQASAQKDAERPPEVSAALMAFEEAEALQVEVFVEAGLLFSVAQQWAKAEEAYEVVLSILEEYEDLDLHTSDVLMRLGLITLNRGRVAVRIGGGVQKQGGGRQRGFTAAASCPVSPLLFTRLTRACLPHVLMINRMRGSILSVSCKCAMQKATCKGMRLPSATTATVSLSTRTMIKRPSSKSRRTCSSKMSWTIARDRCGAVDWTKEACGSKPTATARRRRTFAPLPGTCLFGAGRRVCEHRGL